MRLITSGYEDTVTISRELGRNLQAGDIILLTGDMGAGKTTFSKGIAKGLGITETVTSPTFTIMNQYYGDERLYHFDLYRVEDVDELAEIGVEEFLSPEGIVVIEWWERLDDLPTEYLEIELYFTEDASLNYRELIFKPKGNRYVNLINKLRKSKEVYYLEDNRN